MNWEVRVEFNHPFVWHKMEGHLTMICSQYCTVSAPNVYKHCEPHSMDVNQCYSLRTKYLRALSNSFSNSFIGLYSCKAVLSSDMRRIHKALNILHPQSPYCFKPLNLLQVQCSCEMSTFCEVLHESKQKTLRNSWEGVVETGKKKCLIWHKSA